MEVKLANKKYSNQGTVGGDAELESQASMPICEKAPVSLLRVAEFIKWGEAEQSSTSMSV